jgi:hypothetical protein
MAATLEEFAKWLGGAATPEEREHVEEALAAPAGELVRSLSRLDSLISQRCPRRARAGGDEALLPWMQDELGRLLADPALGERSALLHSNRLLVNELFARFCQPGQVGRPAWRDFFRAAGQVVRMCLEALATEVVRKRGVRPLGEPAAAGGSTGHAAEETLLEQRPTVAFARAYPEAMLAASKRWARLAEEDPEVHEVYAVGELAGRTDREAADLLGLPEDQVRNGRLLAEVLLKAPAGAPGSDQP